MRQKKWLYLSIITFIFLILFILSNHIFNWNQTRNLVKEIYIYNQLKDFYTNKESPVNIYFKRQIDILKFNLYNLFSSNPYNLDIFYIDVQESQIRTNEVLISNILKRDNTLRSHDRYWLEGNLNVDNKNYGIKFRIRGDQPTHWENKKKSWKIKILNQEYLNGYNKFNLIIPRDRWFEVNQSANIIAKKFGLLTPNSKFVLMNFNKKNNGLYFWSEDFDKNFLERHEYPEGEIIIGNDVGFDKIEINQNNDPFLENELLISSYKTIINSNSQITNSALLKWNIFLQLLKSRDLKKIDQDIEEYIDLKKFAIWYSLINIFGSDHSEKLDNLPWYYNSSTGLFEPILYDVQLLKRNPNYMLSSLENEVVKSILLSSKIRQEIGINLNKLVNKDQKYIIETFKNVYETIEKYIYIGIEPIHKDLDSIGSVNLGHLYYSFNNRISVLKENIEDIEEWLNNYRIFLDKEYIIDRDNKNSLLKINIYNENNFDVFLNKIAIKLDKKFIDSNLKINTFDFSKIKILLKRNSLNNYIEITPKNIEFNKDTLFIILNKLAVPNYNRFLIYLDNHSHLLVKEELKKSLFTNIPSAKIIFDFGEIFSNTKYQSKSLLTNIELQFKNSTNNKLIESKLIRSTNLYTTNEKFFYNDYLEDSKKTLKIVKLKNKYNFIESLNKNKINYQIDEKKKKIIIKSGNYELNSSLILDKNYGLEIEKGTILNLGKGVNIILNGPLLMKGTNEKRITISNINNNWGVISVINSKEPSIIEYSNILGGGIKDRAIINYKHFTGMINFINSDVLLSNSEITLSQIEDGLNIKNSKYNINKTTFSQNSGDGFDADWADGIIKNSRFIDNNNDGIDISGSEVTILNCYFELINDKSISVGEDSKVLISDIKIKNSVYGVVSKDLSNVTINNSKFLNNLFAISAYRKKPLFGGGLINSKNNVFVENEFNYVSDDYSSIFINGNKILDDNYHKHLLFLENFKSNSKKLN